VVSLRSRTDALIELLAVSHEAYIYMCPQMPVVPYLLGHTVNQIKNYA
jgi:hypothetical protein